MKMLYEIEESNDKKLSPGDTVITDIHRVGAFNLRLVANVTRGTIFVAKSGFPDRVKLRPINAVINVVKEST